MYFLCHEIYLVYGQQDSVRDPILCIFIFVLILYYIFLTNTIGLYICPVWVQRAYMKIYVPPCKKVWLHEDGRILSV